MNNLKPDEVLFSSEMSLNDGELPIAIFKYENGVFSFVKATDAYLEEMKSIGHRSLEDAENSINDKRLKIYSDFKEYVQICLKTGNPETKDMVVNGQYCLTRMKCERLKSNDNVIMCKAFFLNLSKVGQENTEKDQALRNLYAFYDHINLIDLKNHKIKRIYTNDSQYAIEAKDNDSNDYLRKFSEKYIHPAEVDKYRQYFSLNNIEKNFKSTNKNFILSYFRTKNMDGVYEWKAYILLKTNHEGNKQLYSCVRSVDLTTEHVLIRDNYVELLNELPVAYSVFEVKADDDGTIEDVTCVFASKLTSELMGVPVDDQIGKSVLKMIKLHDGWAEEMYRAAYKQERINEIQYVPTKKKWINIILDKAAEKGRCAVILEDVTKEQLITRRLGREWRTDDLIITCAKFLHCGLPYEEAIDRVIKLVGESIHARRVYIIEDNGDGTYSETFEWCRDLSDSKKEYFQNLRRVDMLNWEEEFMGAFSVIINDVESIKNTHPHMYKILNDFDVNSLVEIPIIDEGQLVGYFGAIDYSEIDALDARQLLETLSYFIATEIVRKKLLQELEKKSIYDTLCDVKNRNAMDITTKRLLRKNLTAGVLYADANGLKRINDTLGHEAGDALLKKMSSIMSECFGKENVYRAGGDEFLVILPKVTEDAFNQKCDELKAMFDNEKDLAVAIGSAWTIDSSGLSEVMRVADKAMYEDKANYYRKNNRRKSRE